MNRYLMVGFLIAVVAASAHAQSPISGSFPPWSSGTPPTPAYSPREVPIITQTPVRYMITDTVMAELQRMVPETVLTKLNPLKGKDYSQIDLMALLGKELKPEEVNQWKEYIFYYSQISSPRLIPVPAGKPLVGFYKMDALLVGADGRYPFDSGEYNLAGFAGNARIYGSFVVTLPAPDRVDPLNAPLYYCSIRAWCQNHMKR